MRSRESGVGYRVSGEVFTTPETRPPTPIQFLIDIPRPGWHNMAIDSALLDRAEQTGTISLRLYRWEPYCLSFGRHEPALRRYDRGRIESLGLDTVRRPTGGRAVWHARELTYALAAPVERFGGIRQAYQAIHRMLAGALRRMGIAAELATTTAVPGPAAGACFATPVGGEVLVDGRKVVGSAQLRQGNAFLQHGSLLLADDQDLVRQISHDPAGVRPRPDPVFPLGKPVSFEEAAAAIREEAGALGELTPDPSMGDPSTSLAHAARFRSPEWTWER
jgi:lipoate-protein ligase A